MPRAEMVRRAFTRLVPPEVLGVNDHSFSLEQFLQRPPPQRERLPSYDVGATLQCCRRFACRSSLVVANQDFANDAVDRVTIAVVVDCW
jgi:hypothetical protein